MSDPGRTAEDPSEDVRPPPLLDAIIPLVTLAVLIGGMIVLYGLDALDGPIQLALVLCCAVAALIGLVERDFDEARADAANG